MIEILPSKVADVGGAAVRRALPQRAKRTIGAWCFVDHFGPSTDPGPESMQIGPHPHIGLQTVTWLLDGQLVHHDSLGTEQPIRAGQLNLMRGGRGIAHAEESPSVGSGRLHGAQLWVALPEATRDGGAAFEHHAALPRVGFGALDATVFIGTLGGASSPARSDTPLLGAELRLQPERSLVPLDASFEHGLVVLDGVVDVDGVRVAPGNLADLGAGRDEVELSGSGVALLLGGSPFDEKVLMWWNFVARSWDEMHAAASAWAEVGSERFGPVRSDLPTVPAPALPSFVTGAHG